MGFDLATIEFLLRAREAGVSLERVLTIGRQGVYVDAAQLRATAARHGIALEAGEAERILTEQKGYCEPLLKRMGAGEIDSLDVSPYEGATILHDLNQPLPEAHHNRYSLVVDGGSLEHVFHLPTAMKSCMQAVAPGGHYIAINPANNMMGHGFYQLSPDLFFKSLTPANGFEVIKILLYEETKPSIWYEVMNPEQIRARVELTNHRLTYMIAWGRKTRSVPIFEETPQQTIYAAIWEKSAGKTLGVADTNPRGPASFWKRHAPAWMAKTYRALRPFHPRLYKRVQ